MRMIKMIYLLSSLFLVAVLLSSCTHINAVRRAHKRQVKSFYDLQKAKKDLDDMMKSKKNMEDKISILKEKRDRLEIEINHLDGSGKIEYSKINKKCAEIDQVNDQIKKQETEINVLKLKIKKKEEEEKKKQQQKDELDKENANDEFI